VQAGYANYTMQLQFFGHDDGRVRAVRTTPQSNPTALVYDYFLKDHLGNVRMVLTEEVRQNVYPAATLESIGSPSSAVDYERNNFYEINTAYVVDKSMATNIPTYNNNNGFDYNHGSLSSTQRMSTASQKLYRLNSTAAKTGMGMTLKVMAGDKLDIHGLSYYINTSAGGSQVPVESILSSFIAAPGSAAAGKITLAQTQTINPAGSALYSFMQDRPEAGIPKAYINYVFFDEQFKFAGGGYSRVNGTAGLKQHFSDLQNIQVPKNGYVYVYCSNETDQNVFFDNLQVIHTQGALMEETHYYPFGLTMAGISSKAAGRLENHQKFTGQILDADLGLNWYQFRYRTHDPQIGRFIQVDPLSSSYPHNSVYAYAENDVVNSIDIEGLERGPVRYMSPSFYTQQKRSYRQVNSFVPRVTSYRNSGSFIPNQSNFNPARPANIYEDFTPGTGEQHNGPFITRNNTIGQLCAKLTELVDDLKSQIERVNVTTDNIFSSNGKTTLSRVDIKWTNKEAEAKFNQAQGAYDNKVNEIRQEGNNRLPEPPGKNATSEEWRSYLQTMQTVMGEVSFQIALLGPSPTQQIINSTQQNTDFNRVNTTYTPLPEVGPAPQQRRQ
jgi:RHS repeat-associated protein